MRFPSAVLLCLLIGSTAYSEPFIGFLDGLQENPPVATPGSGIGTANYDPATQTLDVDVSFSGLVGTTTNAHIHCCATALNQNSGIALHFVPHGFPLGVTSGSFSHTFDLSQTSTYDAGYLAASGGAAELARDRLLAAMRVGVDNNNEVAYFNIHTSFRSGGEIRGNIVPIPEPTSALLLLSGLAIALGMCRVR